MISALGMLVSVVSAFVIVRAKLGEVVDHNKDQESRLRALDMRVDRAEQTEERVKILAGMLSPSERERETREKERLRSDVDHLISSVERLQKLHNGRHPSVES